MDNVLDALAQKYKIDKKIEDGNHGYVKIYHSLLNEKRDKVKKVMEIGIHLGGSLRMWRDFFPFAEVYGLDNIESLLFETDRIHSVLADQKDEITLEKAKETLGDGFDLIVDDGSHKLENQLLSFKVFFSIIKIGGIYAIEDVFPETLDTVKKELEGFNYSIYPSDIKNPSYQLVVITK